MPAFSGGGDFLNKGAAFFVSAQQHYRLTRLLRIYYLLISQPLITIEQMDDATVVKASLCQLLRPLSMRTRATGRSSAVAFLTNRSI